MQGSGTSWVGSVLAFLALLACAAVFLLVAPVFAAHASDSVKKSPWLALALGFGAMFAVPILAVLLFITLLGIPLGLAVLAMYPVLLLTGYVVGVLFLARLVPRALGKQAPTSFARNMGYFALALLIVVLVSRVPFLGGLVIFAITVAGMGACVLEMYRRRQAGPPPGAVPAVS